MFDLVDGDRSGSVTLSEFIKGMNEGNIDMSGRVSKSQVRLGKRNKVGHSAVRIRPH